MTSINSAVVLPSQMAAKTDSVSGQNGNSFISSLSNVKPEQAAALADKTFLALGKDGIKFLPFLTSFVKAFDQPSAGGSASAAPGGSGGSANVDVGAATQALLAFRNANGGVKNLDQALGAIAKALPNLSQADFDSLMASLKATTSAAQASPGMPAMPAMPNMPAMSAQPEIDKFEMGMLESQITAAVGKNTATASSATGNKALDAVIGAITEIGKDGVTADEMESLIGILSATATALLGPEKAEKALANLGLSGNSRLSGSSGSSGAPVSVQISVRGDEGGSAPSAKPKGSSTGRNGFDGMLTAETNLLRGAMESNMNPSSTRYQAYQLFMGGSSALTGGIDSGQEFSNAKAESKKQKPVSSVDLS